MKNRDKIFYVNRRFPIHSGFFSNYHHVMGHIMIAINKGYIPIIDMENYITYYKENHEINNTKNAWEYYFLQPFDHTLDEVYQSKNVILSSGEYPHSPVNTSFDFATNKETIQKHWRIIDKYIKTNSIVNQYTESRIKTVFGDKKNILGVVSRGTDIRISYGQGHKRTPEVGQILAETIDCLKEWNMSWVFLISEEESVINSFKSIFNDRLLVTDSARIDQYDDKTLTPLWKFYREDDN